MARPTVPSGGTAMAPGAADVVRARLQVGNAAVTTALGNQPAGTAPKPSEWAGRMLLAGQDLLGNQAVAKQAAAAPAVPGQQATKKPKPAAPTPPRTKAPPVPKPDLPEKAEAERAEKGARKEDAAGPRSPGADPKFQALKKDVGAKKRRIGSSHPPATTEAGAAQSASVPPADDQEARGKAAHADDMNAAQPKEFNKAAFVKAVEDAIAKRAPKNLDEADKFGDSGKADEVKAEVQGEVDAGKEDSARDIADTTAAAPEPAPDKKEVVPLAADKVPGKPGAPNSEQAAPDQLPPSATDMSAGPAQVKGQMAAADVTEKQLSFKNSREPGFDKAVADKKAMDEHSATAPGELRAGEKKELKQVKGRAAAKGAAAMTAIHAARVTTGRQVGTGKQGTKSSDEDKRAAVTKLLQDLFDKTKCDVEKILSDLDKTVDEQFTTEEKRARNTFTEEHTAGMREYKRKRYKGLPGKARWVKDLFADLPDEANQIYVRAKDHYLTAMRGVIGNIADTVERELRKAKDRIASGRKELRTAVDNLPKDLKAIGREAAAEFDGKFDELTDSVNDKGTALVDTLATKYTDAVKAVDAEIAAEKEKNKGLVSKAADAIGGVINTIRELGRMLMGVLRKAASAVGLILKNPIGFLGNLITGVGGGLKLFMRNAGRHLQQGVLAWLLGTGVGAGLQLPTTFDVLGILVMIAGLLGLSWPNIRDRLARKVDPRAMTAAETGADAIPIVVAAKKRGVAGLWSDLKTRVGDLKKDLIGKLVSYLLPTIIIAGVTWIVSLFNPASAFIRACKMIIDIVRFIVTQGRQIIEFVNTVLDAVIAIARGGTGGVPALVERALARSIPVLIGALAAILGIGGIAGKVKQIFQALARPVNRAIDWVIDKITGLLKKLWAKLKAKLDARKKRRKKPDDRKKPRARRDRRRPRRTRPGRRRDRRGDRRPDRRSDRAKKRALAAAVRDALRLLRAEGATPESVGKGLPGIKRRHRLTSIQLHKRGDDDYSIRVAINPAEETPQVELTDKEFPFELGEAKPPVKVVMLPGAISRLGAIRIPMKGNDPVTGFVINMAAIPSEVKPNIAARYLSEAWKGEEPMRMAPARTAVVIGVNTFERLDPEKDAQGRSKVTAALQKIRHPSRLLLAAFGFVWTPSWRNKKKNRPAGMEEVRRAYRKLGKGSQGAAKQAAAISRNETNWQPGKKLPYGIFHEVIFLSSYSQRAVELLKDVNEQVYSVSQDPDTGVTTRSGDGFLRVYDGILQDARNDPVLVHGGYTFEGFDWGPMAKSRTAQLTTLANQLDRAMKEAIGNVYPQVLYPAEPNMLIKVWENNTSRKVKLIFQDAERLATLRAVESQGSTWGVGAGEGRFFGERLKEWYGVSVAYHPVASVTTSPLPQVLARGLTRTPEDVHLFKRGHPKFPDLPKHPVYAALMQSQTVLGARRLASAFADTHNIDDALKEQLKNTIFRHVEEVAVLMADNPNLSADSPEIAPRFAGLDEAVRTQIRAAAKRGDKSGPDAIRAAGMVTQQMIRTMTADELTTLWRDLKKLLGDILRDKPPSEGGPR